MRALLLIAWRNARHSLGRTAMTLVAVALGVAFLTGSLAVSDTLARNLSVLFSSQYSSVDVVVRGQPVAFGLRADLDEALVGQLAAAPGVSTAGGVVEGFAQPVDLEGQPVASAKKPGLGRTWLADPELQDLPMVAGRGPASAAEVALDVATADRGGLAVGDRLRVATSATVSDVTLVGVVDTSSGTGSPLSWFDPATAQSLLGTPGRVQEIFVAADSGVSAESLATQIGPLLPPDVEVLTGADAAEESQQAVAAVFGFFQVILLVFVGIGLVVCAFIVFNTFAVLTAQRTRQLATLRAIGTSQRQVMLATLGEGAVLGLLGSVIGVVVGYLGTTLLTRVISALGLGDFSGGLVIRPTTVVLSLLAGLLVTLVGAYPAARAAGASPPVGAMRQAAVVPLETSVPQLFVGLVAIPLAILFVARGATQGYPDGMLLLGAGVLALIVGLWAWGRTTIIGLVGLVAPLAGRLGGLAGELGGRNSVREPRRTTVTAGSLALGLTLVSALSVLAASTKATLDSAADDSLTADVIVMPLVGYTPMPATVADAVRDAEGVAASSPILFDSALIAGKPTFVTGVDPVGIGQVVDLNMQAGDEAALGRGDLLVSATVAREVGLTVGQDVYALFAASGVLTLRVGGIFEDNIYAGYYLLDAQRAAEFTGNQGVWYVYAAAEEGTGADAVQASVAEAIAGTANTQVLTLAEYTEWQDQAVDQALAGIYFMLLFAVIVAVVGVANTIALSVSERVREIGLLRAVGLPRRSVSRMILLEALMTSVAGAALGVVVGLFLGVSLRFALASVGFSTLAIPWDTIALFLVLSTAAGVLAAALPARRAARLDVLEAISAQ